MASITVNTNGQTLTVNASISHWTSAALAVVASGDDDIPSTATTTIGAAYTMHFANTATTVTVTVKQLDGTVLFAQELQCSPAVGPRTLNPSPPVGVIAADDRKGAQLALAPTGALAETFSRVGNTIANTGVLTSAREFCYAIYLQAGTTVTNVSFMSSVTAASNPTNWWFTLRTSARVLLAQTADQETAAWAASTMKTVPLEAPVGVTTSGLYYVGVMVKADTVPTLIGVTGIATANGQVPIIAGYGDSTLTDTAPATAAALTTQSAYAWAWVS